MSAPRSYFFPNAELRVMPDRRVLLFPKWCRMIHAEKSRAYAADALRALRKFRRTGKDPFAPGNAA